MTHFLKRFRSALIAPIVCAALAGCSLDSLVDPVPSGPSKLNLSASGCFLAAGSGGSLQQYAASGMLFFPSGYAPIDNFYQQEGLNLVNTYAVSPRGFYYVDDQSPNAYATPEVVNIFGPDGTVLFGRTMLNLQLQQDPSGGTVIAILAHEFAHLLQFKRGVPPGMLAELQADYIAGWYLRRRGGLAWNSLASRLGVFYQLGDYQFNSPTHHGTPAQRLQTAEAGFNSTAVTAGQAYVAGAQYVGLPF